MVVFIKGKGVILSFFWFIKKNEEYFGVSFFLIIILLK